jgi:hypothetical protein
VNHTTYLLGATTFKKIFISIEKFAILLPRTGAEFNGTVSRDFQPSVFSSNNLHWFTGDCFIGSLGVNETAGSHFFVRRFRSLNETRETDSGVIKTAGSDSAVSDPVVSMRPRDPSWHREIIHENDYWLPFPFKRNLSKKKYIRNVYIHSPGSYSVADSGSGAFLPPGFRMNFFRIPDPAPFFWWNLSYIIFKSPYYVISPFLHRTSDPGWKNSRLRDKTSRIRNTVTRKLKILKGNSWQK